MHMMVEALNMHVITVSWDLQYLTCLAESSRAKLKAIEVTEMNSGTTVSQPGNLFYDTLKVIHYRATFLLTKQFPGKESVHGKKYFSAYLPLL